MKNRQFINFLIVIGLLTIFGFIIAISAKAAPNPNPPAPHTIFLPLVINDAEPNAFNIKPILTAPADGAQLSVMQPTLSWQIDPNLDPGAWFKYWISRNPNVSTSNYEDSGVAMAFDGSTMVFGLDANTTYYWIAAYDYYTQGIGWRDGPTTSVRSFRTGSDNAIPMPVLLSPADGSNVNTLIPTITWAVEPALLNASCNFVYWFSTDNFVTWIYGGAWPGAGTSTLLENLQENTLYDWLAQYICYDGYPDWNEYRGPATEVRTLTTGSGYTLPAAPSLISPANGATINTNPVTLSWNPVSGAVEYEIRIYTDCEGFLCWYTNFTSNTSMSTWWLDPYTQNEWEVRGRSNQAWGPWSEKRSFTTGALSSSSSAPLDSTIDQKYYDGDNALIVPNRYAPDQINRYETAPEPPLNE